ncbi:epithelial sodium channel subunit alpha-like [Diadema setosum]|uniref:epithelial sodium channel subunit alpha-like n=1 Tax=Diadema setosum TaxID=31175 RepID=UPI003B3A972E
MAQAAAKDDDAGSKRQGAGYRSLRDIIKEFADSTTAHGIQRIVCAESFPAKCFWTVICLVATGLLLYQGTRIIQDFGQRLVNTKIELVKSSNIEFPGVTVCNMNMMRRSALRNSKYHPLAVWEMGIPLTSTQNEYPELSFKAIEQFDLEGDRTFGMPVVWPTRNDIKKFGHQAEDLILDCTYDWKPCGIENFTQFQHPVYGNCFTFNLPDSETGMALRTSLIGSKSGIHLTLFIEQFEYIGYFAGEAGVRVAIHPANTIPLPEENGFTISPGQQTSVALRVVEIKRKEWPYSKCLGDHVKENYGPFKGMHYTSQFCLQQCYQRVLLEECDCQSALYATTEGKNATTCNITDSYQWRGSSGMAEKKWLKRIEEEELFLYNRLRDKSKKAENILTGLPETRANVARLVVYYEQLNYESIQERPVYTPETLLGGLGGLMGLYIGISVITLAEIAVFCAEIIRYFIRKLRGKIYPEHALND